MNFPDIIKYRRENPLAFRLFSYTLLASILFTLVATATQLYLEYREEVSIIQTRLTQIEQSYSRGLSLGLWNIHEEQINFILHGIMQLPDISYLELTDEDGFIYRAGMPPPGKSMVHQFTIEYLEGPKDDSIYLGSLRVEASLAGVNRRISEKAKIIFLAQSVQVFFISAFIILLVQYLITRHLKTMAHYARKLDINHLDQALVLKRRHGKASDLDELGRVVKSINEMRTNLLHDIEKRRRAEEQLRDSEEKYRLLFSAKSDAILIVEAEDHNIVEVNDGAALLYGYSKDKFTRLNLLDLTTEPEKFVKSLREIDTEQLERIPLSNHRKKDGTIFPVEVSFGSFTWRKRRMLVGIIRDITERQKIEQLKDEMLAAVSHEMSTPLTAMLGFAEFMLENEVDLELQREYLGIIYRECDRLRRLIDNLLSLQQIRAGRGITYLQSVNVIPLLEEVAEFFREESDKHRIVLTCPPTLPPLQGDERALRLALENLVSNAILYSPKGGTVTLGARMENEAVTLWVEDQGPGIPQAAGDEIFDRFFRIDVKNRLKLGGTGLGLPLVKEIALAHKGRVWVESSEGRGSIFYLSIPLEEGASL